MANLFRVVLTSFLLFFSAAASAEIIGYHFSGDSHVYSTISAACVAAIAYDNANYGASTTWALISANSNATCSESGTNKSTGAVNNGYMDYLTTVNNPCTLPQTYNYTTQTCTTPPPPCPAAGTSDGNQYFGTSSSFCSGTCVIQRNVPSPVTNAYLFANCVTASGNNASSLSDTVVGCTFPAQYTGDTCSTANQPTKPPVVAPTPVNPIPVAPQVSSPTPSPAPVAITPSQAAAGAAAAGAAAGSAGAAAGAAAAAAGESAAGQTAAANAAGSAAAAAANPTPDFCANHPTSSVCVNPSQIGSGVCSGGFLSGFTCSGDAIQCAIAQQAQQARCAELMTDTTTDLGGQLINGTAPSTGTDPFANPTSVAIGSLDTTSFLPKGCLADMNFTIVGKNIVLPLSRLCEGLQTAGKIVLAFAYMIAARIIFS